MSSDSFHVDTTIKSVPLQGQHKIAFTVTNELGRQVRVNAYLELSKDDRPLDGIKWIQIVEPATFDLAPDGSATVQVSIDVPATLPADWTAQKTSLQLRLVVRNIDRPDDERGESVRITLHPERPEGPAATPKAPPNLWLILAIAGGAVVLAGIIGLIIFFATRDRTPEPPPPSTTGTVEVRVATSGPSSDSNRYQISLDGSDTRTTTAATTSVVFENVSAGNHLVTLTGQPATCEVRDAATPAGSSPGNALSVTVTAGQQVAAGFSVICRVVVQQRMVWTTFDGGDLDIFMATIDGADRTNLTTNLPSHERNPRVSPDGSRIVFESDRDGNPEIYVMNIDGSSLRNVSNHPGHDTTPAWSPDGARIVFSSSRLGNELVIVNADGSASRALTGLGLNNADPAWSPDGRRIAFDHGTGENDVALVEVATGVVTMLTNSPGVIDDQPDWSPDGSQIAFSSSRDGQREIYIMRADGTNPVRLTSTASLTESQPAWSPDGRRLLFQAGGSLRVMNVDGAQMESLGFASGRDPRWVPLR